jgi:hypothetical protein
LNPKRWKDTEIFYTNKNYSYKVHILKYSVKKINETVGLYIYIYIYIYISLLFHCIFLIYIYMYIYIYISSKIVSA